MPMALYVLHILRNLNRGNPVLGTSVGMFNILIEDKVASKVPKHAGPHHFADRGSGSRRGRLTLKENIRKLSVCVKSSLLPSGE